jgi:MinD-like ATPase involved in chromosome partitioning or flagellar assembly
MLFRYGDTAVTPDRNDQMHPGDAEPEENGVLAETGTLDASGFGFLGGQTEQVSVVLPSASDEDFADDDVIDDEVSLDALGITEADVDAELDAGDAVTGEVEIEDWIDEDRIASEETVAAESAPGGHDSGVAPGVYDSAPAIEDASVVEEPAQEVPAPETPAEPAERPSAAAAVRPFTWDTRTPDAAPSVASSAPAVPPPPAPAVPAPAAAARPATGPVPATRREAQHPESEDRAEHGNAVERVIPRADVSMTSKRLGEFEGGRETADLLTADRLLDPHQIVRPEPEGAWQHFVYSVTGRRINLGDGKRARARKELDRRIAAPLNGGARFVPVLSRKGGVGKTTVTTLLGMALADARDDRIIAVDANPDRGTLAERVSRSSGKTVRDLVRVRSEVSGYNDISNIVARDETRLDVLASDSDPRVSEALNDRDYHDIASLAAHYYSIVLTDTGTGIVHSVMGATLDLADQLVVVAGLTVDEARLASETLTWLETNGYSEHVRNAIVVLNSARPGTPLVRQDELEGHFRTRVRTVVRIPYDAHIAAGSAISFRDLQPATRLAARDLAASVVEGLRSLAPAA